MHYTGTIVYERDDIHQLQLQLAELSIQLNWNSQTTQTAHDLGVVSIYPIIFTHIALFGYGLYKVSIDVDQHLIVQ